MTYLLSRPNCYGETWYFVRLGHPMERRPDVYPIEMTTLDRAKAHAFDCLKDALETWIKANRVPGWRVLEMDGEVVKQVIET